MPQGLHTASFLLLRSYNAQKEVPDEEAALSGARDIIAETVSDDAEIRKTLRELLGRFQSQIKEQLAPRRMASIMAYNVRTQAHVLFRHIPMGIKCAVMRLAYRFFGESNSSITLTNIGNIQLPEEMAPHVERMQCILTPRAGSPYNCAVIALNGKLTITFSRFCRQPELEAVFFRKLDEILATV